MKVCSKCGKPKRQSSFSWSNQKKGYRRGECKKCAYELASDWWRRSTIEQRQKKYKQGVIDQRKRAERNIRWLVSYLKNHPCIKCSESNIIVLEFHHRNPKKKKYSISSLVSTGQSLKLIIKEVKKCNVQCANCHRIETAHQLKYRILKYV